MSWTNTRIERLKEAWVKDGFSAGEIAKEFGDTTRSAVIGKLLRLGLMGHGGNPAGFTPQARRTKARTKTFINANSVAHNIEQRRLEAKRRQREAEARHRARNGSLPKPKPAPGAPTPLMVKLVDLEAHHCRFPIGEPFDSDFGFCGHDRREDRPYCTYHCGVAFEAPRMRRKLAA